MSRVKDALEQINEEDTAIMEQLMGGDTTAPRSIYQMLQHHLDLTDEEMPELTHYVETVVSETRTVSDVFYNSIIMLILGDRLRKNLVKA